MLNWSLLWVRDTNILAYVYLYTILYLKSLRKHLIRVPKFPFDCAASGPGTCFCEQCRAVVSDVNFKAQKCHFWVASFSLLYIPLPTCAGWSYVYYQIKKKPSTLAKDKAILLKNPDPILASCYFQELLNSRETWFHKWNLNMNARKSVHVTFAF